MNIYKLDILHSLMTGCSSNQRDLSRQTGHSLGKVNSSLSSLIQEGYITNQKTITDKTKSLFESFRPHNAIILAAGYGLRMVPLNTEIPKGLLEVHGEPLIERTIKQLQEAGITDIHIVVGYQKEKYEYLIDQYQVNLIVNMEYSTKNNLHSLYKASRYLGNSYIIPCDLYSVHNPYSTFEPYDWYMVSDRTTDKSTVKINRQGQLVSIPAKSSGPAMLGISYLTSETATRLTETMKEWCQSSVYDNAFWDDALFATPDIRIHGRLVSQMDVMEIDTFEQLRALDSSSDQLKTSAMQIIAKTFDTTIDQITNIETLKKGMTNRSFLFTCKNERFIMRIPGEGTDMLINRRNETAVYDAINGLHICDDVLYMNPENGYKITRFLEGARVCDPVNEDDLCKCMGKLRDFHNLRIQVGHMFDIFGQIDYYESLWTTSKSVYRDYESTKQNVMKLKSYIDAQPKSFCLTHIDAVPDNFLLIEQGNDTLIRLIDWEYAGMQDPHVDIAMFCIYALYDKSQVDHLINLYFENQCPPKTRTKIYAYIAASGLLWSNWCEYKSQLGVEFGEYALKQYRYAKEYYRYAITEMEQYNEYS